jgi:hypothetical protein
MNINGAVLSYDDYLKEMEQLVADKKTSGHDQSQMLVAFTALNLTRMTRLNRTIALDARLAALMPSLTTNQTWYLIGEAWCGDCAQNIPALGKIAETSNGKIDLKIIGRDDNPEWMEKYHTNGSRSIPKLIAFDEAGNELFTWGPRPAPAQKILKAWKENPAGRSWEDFEKELHTWYSKDKTESMQKEFIDLLSRVVR